MPRIVEVPGVGNVEFPDGMDDAAISAQIRKSQNLGPPPVIRPASMTERVTGGLSRAASNLPKSGIGLMEGMVDAVTNPRRTLSGIANTVEGGLNRGAEMFGKAVGLPGSLTPEEEQKARQFDGVVDHYKKRYGSPSAAWETFQDDPVGMASDVSAVAGAASAIPGRVGKVAAAASEAANPMIGPSRAIGTGVRKAIPKTWAAEKAVEKYQSALKVPPSWHSPDELKGMLNTAMDEGIALDMIPSRGKALQKTRGKIDDINNTVKSAVAEGAAEGKVVDPVKVAEATRRSKEAFTTVDPADKAPIDALKKRFLDGQSVDAPYTKVVPSLDDGGGYVPVGEGVNKVPIDIPVDKAQRLKQNTYRELRDSAYDGQQVGALREGKKDLAHGLMQGVYDQLKAKHPELATLGAKEKVLIDLEDAIERFTTRQGNRDGISLKTMTSAGSNPVLAVYEMITDNPAFKSRLAIALRRASQNKRMTNFNGSIRQGINAGAAVGRAATAAEEQ